MFSASRFSSKSEERLNTTSLVRWMKGHGSWMVTGPTRLYKGYFTGNNFPWAHRGRCARDRPRSARPPPSQGGRTRPGNTCGEIVPTDEKSIWTMNRKDINGVYIILPFAKKRDQFVWRCFVTLSLFRVFPYNVRNVLQIFQNILVFYYRKYVKYHSSQNPWNKLNLQTKNSAKKIDAMFRNRMKYASHMEFD